MNETVQSFRGKKILIIGDIMLDKYIHGKVQRISPEAPVPILRVKNELYTLGGAANVANNVAALGGKAILIGAVGKDHPAQIINKLLKQKKIISGLVTDNKPTIQKARVVSQSQQLMRIDYEITNPISQSAEKKAIEKIQKLSKQADIIILSDYAKGFFTSKIVSTILASKKQVLVDPKPKNISLFRNATLITPNMKEAQSITGLSAETNQEVDIIGKTLVEITNANVLLTRGSKGMSLYTKTGGIKHIPTQAKEVYDVSGAGDTVISTIALSLSCGADLYQAALIANKAAGIVVGKAGTATTSIKELSSSQKRTKIKTLEELKAIADDVKRKGKKIVFTNGCFDILHVGHTRYLEEAKSFGDLLILGLNSDESVQRLKGPTRPVVSEMDRAEVLSNLSSVDYICFFTEDTPNNVIKTIQPDIHVKGGDYTVDQLPEAKIIKKYGGEIRIVNLVEGRSTTKIIQKANK